MTSIERRSSRLDQGPIFLTGLAGSGKTEVRRLLDHLPGLEMSRKTAPWVKLRTRSHVDRAVEAARVESGRWGVQRKGLERWAGFLFEREPHARIVHLVRDPAACAVSRRPGGRGRALARWANSTSMGVQHSVRRPDAYRLVRIEDVATDPTAPDLARFLSIGELPRVGEVDWTGFARTDLEADALVEHVRWLYPDLGYASPPSAGRRRRPRLTDLIAYAAIRMAGRTRVWLVRQ